MVAPGMGTFHIHERKLFRIAIAQLCCLGPQPPAELTQLSHVFDAGAEHEASDPGMTTSRPRTGAAYFAEPFARVVELAHMRQAARLRTHSEKSTVAAQATSDRKTFGHLS